MSDEFDAYDAWLGIDAQHQPPDHYRLLDIEQFEANPAVIDDAAKRQLARVRSFANGPEADHAQRLLDEIGKAHICLLDPFSKGDYDQSLQDQYPPVAATTVSVFGSPDPPSPDVPVLATAASEPVAASPVSKSPPMLEIVSDPSDSARPTPAITPAITPATTPASRPSARDRQKVGGSLGRGGILALFGVVGGVLGVVLGAAVVMVVKSADDDGGEETNKRRAVAEQRTAPKRNTKGDALRPPQTRNEKSGTPAVNKTHDDDGQPTIKTEPEPRDVKGVVEEDIRGDDPPAATADASAHLEQGNIHFTARQFDDAIAEYTKAIQASSDDAQSVLAYCKRAASYCAAGAHDKAIADCDEAIALVPNSAAAYASRALAHLGATEDDKAIADATEALRLDAENADAYYYRAAANGFLGDDDKAIEDCSEAIRLDPNHADAFYRRGMVYFGKGDHDTAIADLSAAIRLDESHADAFYHRSIVHTKLGETDKAFEDLDAAYELGQLQTKVIVRAVEVTAERERNVATLIDKLENELSSARRKMAIRELSELKLTPEAAGPAMEALLAALSDSSTEVQSEALIALAQHAEHSVMAIPRLAELVDQTDVNSVREAAVVAIMHIDPTCRELREILTRALVGGRGTRIRPSTERIVHLNRTWACEALAALGEHAVWSVRLLGDLMKVLELDLDDLDNRKLFLTAIETAGTIVADEPRVRLQLEAYRGGERLESDSSNFLEDARVAADMALREMHAATALSYRDWQTRDGSFKALARLVEVQRDHAVLQRRDNRHEVTIKLADLRPDDRDFALQENPVVDLQKIVAASEGFGSGSSLSEAGENRSALKSRLAAMALGKTCVARFHVSNVTAQPNRPRFATGSCRELDSVLRGGSTGRRFGTVHAPTMNIPLIVKSSTQVGAGDILEIRGKLVLSDEPVERHAVCLGQLRDTLLYVHVCKFTQSVQRSAFSEQ